MLQQCQDKANICLKLTLNTTSVDVQSNQAFFFKPNLVLICFLFLFSGKKNTFHPLPLKYCLPHVLGDIRVTNLYKASESSYRLSVRGETLTDTVRDTSCACQSGNFFMRKVQNMFHVNCLLWWHFAVWTLTSVFSLIFSDSHALF